MGITIGNTKDVRFYEPSSIEELILTVKGLNEPVVVSGMWLYSIGIQFENKTGDAARAELEKAGISSDIVEDYDARVFYPDPKEIIKVG